MRKSPIGFEMEMEMETRGPLGFGRLGTPKKTIGFAPDSKSPIGVAPDARPPTLRISPIPMYQKSHRGCPRCQKSHRCPFHFPQTTAKYEAERVFCGKSAIGFAGRQPEGPGELRGGRSARAKRMFL